MACILTDRNPGRSPRRRAGFRMRASASLSLGRPRMGFRRLAELGMSSAFRNCCIFTLHCASNICEGIRMTHLFDPLAIRDITFANRVFVSPMCEYSSADGYANDWHFVHLGSRAVGGAGLVLTEATAVLPEGRISPDDFGVWMDEHIEPLARIARFIHEQGSVAGMQLAHAGRKASTYRPWAGHGTVPERKGGWNNVVAPSALAFTTGYPMPRAHSIDGIKNIVSAFSAAARRACEAGFD